MGTVTLSWNAQDQLISPLKYLVQWSTVSNFSIVQGQTLTSNTTWDQTFAQNAKIYWRVRVQDTDNDDNHSDWSAPIYFTTNPLLSPPTGASASDGTYSDYIKITWNSASNAYKYQIYRNTGNNFSTSSNLGYMPASSGTFWYDEVDDSNPPVYGQTYYYWIVTEDISGNRSQQSNSNSGYLDAPAVLSYVAVSGPTAVDENSRTQYICTAYYSDGSSYNVTNDASWTIGWNNTGMNSYGAISDGNFTTFPVPSNISCTVTGYYNGKSANVNVSIVDTDNTVVTPSISPNGGTFTGLTQVSLSCSASGATIHYTMNSSTPTSSSTEYSLPFTVSSSCTIKAKAFKSGYTDSDVASASFTIMSSGVTAQSIPYAQDFSSGKPGDSEGWEYYSSDNGGRIEVVSGQLRMDRSPSGTYTLNEAILHLDLSGQSNVILTLDHLNSNDETHSLKSSFTGHSNGDGIAISADGTDWYLLTSLTTSFTGQEFDLDAAIQSSGISYTSDFQIKFQQYDNYLWSTDGRAFDNISVFVGAAAKPDFNGNGTTDILWHRSSTGSHYTTLMNGTTKGSYRYLGGNGDGLEIIGTGDFDGNGKTDLLWYRSSTGSNYITLMNGTTKGSYSYLGGNGDGLVIVGTGDFNGDGKTDLLWYRSSTGSNYITLMNGTTKGSYTYLGGNGDGLEILGTGDFDGNGKTDLLWYRSSTGSNYITLMNGATKGSYGYIAGNGDGLDIIGTGDFDGNGKTDLLWYRSSTGSHYTTLMNGTTKGSYRYLAGNGDGLEIIGTGDFDGNGKTDLLWYRSSTGSNYITLMNGTTKGSYSYLAGNGDGLEIVPKVDLIDNETWPIIK
ncbi:MAG: FG-GAP-like repeat-containing protein [Phycisphaerae bacterium]|nr:FG-GAP-like repeat-containing protein [Phycisphaerae bacterium]